MDADQFDTLTKVVGRGATRRRVVRGVLGSVLAGGAITLTGRGPVQAAPQCRGQGQTCEGNQDCCAGLVCRVIGLGNSRRCARPPFPGDPFTCPD
jgi:hypothetical protein